MEKTRQSYYKIVYTFFAALFAAFIVFAFIVDTPANIVSGLIKIMTSRSVLVTDYIALGGIGAAFVNSAISGLFFLVVVAVVCKKEPDGMIIAGMWLTTGFAFFGKNFVNTLPIVLGVWLYTRIVKHPFSQHLTNAMFGATVGPVVSEIYFLGERVTVPQILLGIAVGIGIGLVFPIVAASVVRVHSGYCLYNSGVAGGLITTLCVCVLRSAGIEIVPENIWDTSNTVILAVFCYTLAAVLIALGIWMDGVEDVKRKGRRLIQESGRFVSDFFTRYRGTAFVNMGTLCALATSLMLVLNIPVNGAVIGGILTVTGFGGMGKHVKNVAPIFLGGVIATFFNHLEQDAASNTLALLFSSGLAPVAGRFGWRWGITAGFMHVMIAVFVGQLNGGLNLYNNGFAGGLVALLIVPVIITVKGWQKSHADAVKKSHLNDDVDKEEYSHW